MGSGDHSTRRRVRRATVGIVAAACFGNASAKYIHDDPAGVAHPGCLRAEPLLVSRHRGGIASANQSCPGSPMTDVWDFDSDLYPFNLERARDAFDAFWVDNNLVKSNDFNPPHFVDYEEPGTPRTRRVGYTWPGTKYWRYKFSWQTETQQQNTTGFNMDIALEQINATIVKEKPLLIAYLAENGCATIDTASLMPLLDSAMRTDFDKTQRHRFSGGWRRNETLTEPEVTLGYLNDELERLMTSRNRTAERGGLDAYKSQTGVSTGDYSFLSGVADDVDECIQNIGDFNEEITAQVQSKYAEQQELKFRDFLSRAKYADVVNTAGTPDIKISVFNENLPRVNELVEAEVKKRWVNGFNLAVSKWLKGKGSLYETITGVAVNSHAPNMTHLNFLIEGQVASSWIAAANAAFDDWQSSEGLGFITVAPIDARNPDVAAMNADAKTQAEADWVTRASAGFTTHLSTNAYTYATGIDVTGVNDDIAALNANLETQVKAEWVRNAQRDFHAWLVTKAYNDDVAAVITSTSQSIAQLNKAVEAKVASAHIGDADGEFQRWLTQRAYTYVAGVTIDEVDEDIAGVNAAVEAQVTQRWVSDADAALQQWLSARGLASVVSASVTSTTQNLGSLNDDIDAQTVDDWVATENGGIAAWLQARGYDGAVPVASVQLDASDTSARVSGYPAYPASVNSAVQTAVEQDWIADAESDLRSWLVTKNYDGFVTTSDVFITITSPNLAQINAVIETKVEQDWIDSTDAELQLWLSSNGYGDVVATVDDVAENFPTLNEDIETQAKADWVADAQAELTSYLTRNGYGYVTGASVTSVTQNLNTLNAVIASQVDSQWVTDANSALQAWLSGERYQSLVSVSVTNSSPDFSEINADVETAVKADYVTSVNTEINQWVTDNKLDDYFVAGTDKLSDTDDVPGDLSSINDAVSGKMENEWIAETNADFQNWLLAEFGANVTDASILQITSADQDMAELNTQVENLARGLLPEMGDVYVPYDPVAFDGFVAFEVAEAYSYVQYAPAITSAPAVPNFAPSRGAFGSYVAFTPSSTYPAYVAFTLTNYPGYVAHTVASAFPDLTSEFTRTAFTYEAFTQGVSYAAYVPFALRNGAYPGFTEFEVDTFTFNAFTLAKYPTYVEFTNEDPYPAYVNFEMVPAYAHTPYVHLREHSFTPYSLQTPNHPRWWSDRYTQYWIRDPKQIDKHDMGKLFYYHKAWYYQEMFVCRATCVGTMGQNTEVDTDFLAPDRVCDSDDHLCPVANTPSPVGTNKHGAWEEFNLILEARDSHLGKHPECPVRDPCRTSPPPCFYVTSECIPDILVNTRINNTDLRSREDIEFNEDEKYLHEPMTVSDIVEWKLVSGRLDRPGAPKLWNYWTGLDMAAFTSPKDKQKYHKVCTFALVEKTTERFERGVEYGFSIAERNRKNEEGHTQAGQNSYRAPNHVYDVGHVGDIERWQRSFGETVSPLLDNECSGRFASQWRNRRYSPAQQFGSVSKVWGTCADTCAQLSDASSSDSAAAEATLGVAQTINAVITRAAALGAKRGSGMGKQSQSGAKHVDGAHVAVVFVSVAGIAALALAASRRHKNDLAAAECVPLLAKPAVLFV